jgi:signal transduction histidine kinase/ActR/RegA family two-component response regulator
VSVDPPLPGDPQAVRIAREHLRLARRQIGRIPLPYLLIDVFLCWLLVRLDLVLPALTWFAALVVVQTWRWRYARQHAADVQVDPAQVLQRLAAFLLALGVLRAAIVPLLFMRPLQYEHFMFTLVYLGMIAGTSASVGGELRPFLLYSLLAGGSLAMGYGLQGTPESIWIGVLILCLIAVMGAHLSDQAKGLAQFVQLAIDNERLAESLRRARDAAEAASLSKTRFFAAASHDLRQPLHALSINATTLELLATRQGDPLIKELSHSINRALGQSNGLLDSLLEISKLDAQAIKPHLQGVDLTRMLTSAHDEFAALAAYNGLALRLDLPPQPLVATTDPLLLRRILTNLVGNALKFTTCGSVTLRAGVVAGARPPRVAIAVIDTGPGIAEAEQARVFEEFYQIDNAGRDRNLGLGLGLAIVQRTASLLGAGLRLNSRPGQGTLVELDLPADTVSPPAGEDIVIPLAVEAGMLQGLKVMLVDDEVEIRRSLQGLLLQLGCELRCAAGQAQAVAHLEEGFVPQVLLVDHRLRGERGTEVIAGLRARLGPVAAVLVTGDTEPALIQAARAAGHQVVHKPVQGPVLAGLLLDLQRRATQPPHLRHTDGG